MKNKSLSEGDFKNQFHGMNETSTTANENMAKTTTKEIIATLRHIY